MTNDKIREVIEQSVTRSIKNKNFGNIRLFSHRGFTQEGVKENSLPSLKKAQEMGFQAIEFDIWFVDGELILKHSEPKPNEFRDLAKFEDFFCFGNDFSYWLDFKNLNQANIKEALGLAQRTINNFGLNLERVYFAPFITDYRIAAEILAEIRKAFGSKVNLVGVCEKLEGQEDQKILREFLSQNQIKFLSIFHRLIDQEFIDNFFDVEIFAWTVNDLDRLKNLKNLGVRNFATDKITPTYLK